MLRKHIVVVGSGWAGLRLVRKLKKVNYSDIRITLVSDSPNFRYSAALYRAATGFKVQEAIIPISQLTSDIPSLSFIKSKATKINKQKRIITLSGGQELHYDYAVLALGSVTTYFGIPGLSEYSYGIKSLSEIDRLRNHLHKELLENNKPDKNYIVIGAGPTGVELSAALISYLKKASKRHGIKHRRINIELIEASPRVLPRSLPKVSKLVHKRLRKIGVKVKINSKVEYETDTDLVVDGKSIPSKTVIWTSGVSNSPFYNANKSQFMLNNRSQVIVDDHLRVDKRLFVIGDNAVTPYTGLGLTAVHNASFVANEIIKKINGHNKTKPYKPLVPATVIPVGNRWAIFNYKQLIIWGWLGSIIRSLADFAAYHDIAGFYKGSKIWLQSGDKEEVCAVCKSALKTESTFTKIVELTES